jgi:lipoate-protein ligase A
MNTDFKSRPWLLLESGSGSAAFNMAVDEALLEAMPLLQRPVLRFYGWTEPAASFGYFQRYSEVERATLLRPLVRRPTGGGIVPHDADWTYSLAIPTCHEWYGFAAVDSYRRVHEWIQDAFQRLKIVTELSTVRRKAERGECFIGCEKFDLLWRAQKIAGAAQRRTRAGLMIQGSVQPPVPSIARAQWQSEMRAVAAANGVEWGRLEWNPDLAARAGELEAQKYSRPEYNQKR